MRPFRPLASLSQAAVFGLAFLALAEGGRLLSFPAASFATFWPPSGLYLVVLLFTGRARWPVWIVGGVIANLVSDVLLHGETLLVGVAFSLGNAAAALTGAWLLQFFATPLNLNRVKSVLALATLPTLVSTTLSATVGATTIWATQEGGAWVATWFVWWSGHAVGVLLITPVLAIFATHRSLRSRIGSWWRVLELALLLLGVTGASMLAFGQPAAALLARPVTLLPFLLWMALRFGSAGSAWVMLIPALLIEWHAVHGVGPFAVPGTTMESQAVVMQAALFLMSFSTLLFAALIRERHDAAETIRLLERRALHAERVQSLGVLAGGIAHDFNNLLTALMGNASLALEDLPSGSPTRPMLRSIQTAAERAADLTRQMLAYAGKSVFVFETIRLDLLVRDLSCARPASGEISVHFDLKPVSIAGDAAHIRWVVAQLFTNAFEAHEAKQGAIMVRTATCSIDSGPEGSLPAGAYSSLEVEDTGCGMNETQLTRIFDPFFTTKFVGRGLGLPAALGIVKGHRGTIEIASTPGRGTLVKVLIPSVESAARDAASTSATAGG